MARVHRKRIMTMTGMIFLFEMKIPCKHPGCRALLDKSGYCQAHASSAPRRNALYDKHVRAKDSALSGASAIRNSTRWRKVRLLKLSQDPLCEDPHGDHARRNDTATGSQVHHIQGLATHPELAFVWSNLMSVCTKCHAKLEAQARLGRIL